MKKLISIVVPIFNEKEMLDEICCRINQTMAPLTSKYDYEIVFFDDGSTDGTREKIDEICKLDTNIKAVFYSRNFGYIKNTFYCVQQAKGDCAIIIHADLQNPPEMIPEFLRLWEKDSDVVLGIKNKSKENQIIYSFRTLFYFFMRFLFGVKLTPHATDFGLFDKSFIEVLNKIKSATPFLRGIVLEYASNVTYTKYTQDRRRKGKSKFNLNKYYDFAMCGIVHYSRIIPRRLIAFSAMGLTVTIAELVVYCINNIANFSWFILSNSIFLRCAVGLLFIVLGSIGFFSEFVINIQKNVNSEPLVIEKYRINY